MTYNPKPIDTADIELPPSLAHLSEKLAENAHEAWAQQRMADGWVYGPERSDQKKTHPCLVPYDELPESEKEYDRVTALGTLKVVLKLGYSILPPGDRK